MHGRAGFSKKVRSSRLGREKRSGLYEVACKTGPGGGGGDFDDQGGWFFSCHDEPSRHYAEFIQKLAGQQRFTIIKCYVSIFEISITSRIEAPDKKAGMIFYSPHLLILI